MSTGELQLRVECYVAVRKALGYACRSEEKLLKNFVQFLELNRVSGPIRAQTAIEWVCASTHGPAPSGQTNRLRVVRGFLSHLQAFEFETEVPTPGVLAPILRPLPYLYSPDEVAALMKEVARLGPYDSLRPDWLFKPNSESRVWFLCIPRAPRRSLSTLPKESVWATMRCRMLSSCLNGVLTLAITHVTRPSLGLLNVPGFASVPALADLAFI